MESTPENLPERLMWFHEAVKQNPHFLIMAPLVEAAEEIKHLRAALAAETERCARIADEVAKTAREEAALFSAKGDYTDANHYNGYADGCEEVAAAIRARG